MRNGNEFEGQIMIGREGDAQLDLVRRDLVRMKSHYEIAHEKKIFDEIYTDGNKMAVVPSFFLLSTIVKRWRS
jgi:hypothetical protein